MDRNNGMQGAHQACAACKHQRKKCTEKCILAPFFPADRIREFQAVHKVFGVSNVQKIVRGLNEDDRKRAADSLVWEAFCRQKDPVLGPYGEYIRVYDELKLYKSQAVAQNGLVFKSETLGLMGWNINNNGSFSSKNMGAVGGVKDNTSSIDFIRGNGNSIIDRSQYSFADSHHLQGAEKVRKERDIASVVAPPQHLVTGFNQQYYLSGHLSPLDAKSIESSIWEGGS
ncbi:hypothetical protein Ancab_029533 [Ancistrocladus abbreviatus]